MRGGRVPAAASHAIGWCELVAADGTWKSGPVVVARDRRTRRRGLRPCAHGRGMLLRTRSVHGWGMAHALLAVALDGDGRVVGTSVLPPRGLVVFARAHWILELPPDVGAPAPGVALCAVRRKLPR